MNVVDRIRLRFVIRRQRKKNNRSKINQPELVQDRIFIDSSYSIYGKCPNCGDKVYNCSNKIDKRCKKCNQLLVWM